MHNFQSISYLFEGQMNYIFPIIKMNKLSFLAAGKLGPAIEPDGLNEKKGINCYLILAI